MKFSSTSSLLASVLLLSLVACDEQKGAGTSGASSAMPGNSAASSATTHSAMPATATTVAVDTTPPKPGAAPAEWTIDDAHSKVGFSAKHLLISTVTGQFNKFSGKAFIDETTLANTKLSVEIDVKSVDTRQPDRDKHLRTSDFFDADKHPKMTFVSTHVERDGKNLKVTGDLTMRGVTKPVVLTVDTLTPEVDSPAPGWKLRGAHATGKINRKDFGVAWDNKALNGSAVVSDDIGIELDVELKREAKADMKADGGATAMAAGSASATAAPKASAAPTMAPKPH